MKRIKGSLILLTAAFIWGTTFAAQTAASEYVGSFTFNFCRCVVGSLFLLAVACVRTVHGKQSDVPQKNPWPWVPGLVCGTVLFLAMNLQQTGIGMYPAEAAASGRSGFLTAAYVVMVAAITQLTGRKSGTRLDPFLLAAIAVTVAGMYLLCLSGGLTRFYAGDILELLCAVCFTAHILVVDHFSRADSIKLSCLQFVICGLLSLLPMILLEAPQISDILSAGIPILYAGILSSGVAYTLQMVGQKYAPPAVASIVMSMESVFAVLAGCVLLGEVMTLREIAGCALMFAAVLLAQVPRRS